MGMARGGDELAGCWARLSEALAAVAERLRQVTVQVDGRGPGRGSGVIWRPDGVIVTNAHVARGRRAAVELADGRTLEAEVSARDPWLDLARLEVSAADLPAAVVGDSHALRVGELVLAFGHPLGSRGALTMGIVQAIDAAETAHGPRWVRADIRLAPGNSGGPLADARGRIVGVNSLIAGGLALAVPSRLVEGFLRRGRARSYLGVTTRPVFVTVQGQRRFGLLVLEVAAGSPAEAAGIELGDVLLGVAGRALRGPDDLVAALGYASPGETLRLDLSRGGRCCAREVAVRAGPSAAEAA
jgi:serine protease Do